VENNNNIENFRRGEKKAASFSGWLPSSFSAVRCGIFEGCVGAEALKFWKMFRKNEMVESVSFLDS